MKRTKLRSLSRCAFALAALVIVPGCVSVEPKRPTAEAKADAAAPTTHTVTRASAKAKPALDAVFEAVEMAPVKLEPKGWTDLTVLDAVAHGARVRKGDVLVRLDTEKLKEQIGEQEQDLRGTPLAVELAVAELENLEQTTPLKLDAAKRAQRIANEDFAYFEKTGRSQKEKAARFNVKGAEQRLEGAQEELKQLEKMYKADDLVEETEEIVLKRQKFAVEASEYSLEVTKQGADLSLRTAIPRENETLKTQKRDQELALALAGESLHRNLSKKRLEVEKLKRDQKKAEKKLADLKKDMESLASIRAPMNGIVYYGACEGGRWTTGAAVAKKLIPTGKLTPNEIFMTIVDPEKLVLKAVVQEGDLAQFTTGMEGKASPVSAPDRKLAVKLEELGVVPLPTGGFEARLSVKNAPGVRLVPGMNAKVVFGEPSNPEALVAPKEAVFTESGQSHVFVLKSDGQHEKRAVKTGASDGKMVEVLQGLSEGDKILLSKPK